MNCRRKHSQYDRVQGRADVEDHAADAYSGKMVVSAMFSYRPPSDLTDKRIEEQIKR